MSRLALYALKSMPQAVLAAAVFLILSLLFPPFAWLSSALIAVVVLRKGWRYGLCVVGLSTIGAAVLLYVSLGGGRSVLVLVLLFWLPVFLMASALRAYVRLDVSLLLAAAMGFIALSAIYLIHDDPSAIWLELLREVMQVEVWADQFRVPPEEFDNFLVEVSTLMPGSTVAGLVFSAVVSLLLARSWQAKVFNPGGFQTEYHRLRYGRYAAIAALVIASLSLLVHSSYTLGLLAIVIVVFLFQGIAIIHAVVKLKSLGTGWLIAMYTICAMLPQMVVILGGIGLLDTWLDSRKWFAASAAAK